MDTATCAICLELLNSKPSYKLHCDHEFHTECQIEWFRTGSSSCPTCRSNGNTMGDIRRYQKNQTAFQIMCKEARMDGAPIVLKRAYEKYKKAKARETELTKEITTCRQKEGKYSEINKEYCILRRKRFNASRTTRILHREISSLCQIITRFV